MRRPRPATIDLPGLPPFAPLVCYEAIFPGAIIDESDRPAWMLNVTNDAWYGRSSGPYQHFAIARTRAVEEGLPLVRVANNGISAVVDPLGRVLARTDLDAIGYVDAALPAPSPAPRTPASVTGCCWGCWFSGPCRWRSGCIEPSAPPYGCIGLLKVEASA